MRTKGELTLRNQDLAQVRPGAHTFLLDICSPFVLISKGSLQRMRFFAFIVHERDLIRLTIWQRSFSRRFVEIRSLQSSKMIASKELNPPRMSFKKWAY